MQRHKFVLILICSTLLPASLLFAETDSARQTIAMKKLCSFELGSTRKAAPMRIKATVSAGGKKISYNFSFAAFPYNDERYPDSKVHANARSFSIFMGEANFGGKQCKIAIAGLNSNSLFNDVEKGIFTAGRFFVDLNGDGKFKHSSPNSRAEEGFPYGKYLQIDGKWYCIEATPNGTTVHITPAQPQLATVSAQKSIESVALYSDEQSQTLRFSEGSAKAIVGTYDLAAVVLRADGDSGRPWSCTGTFRSDRPQVTIAPGSEIRIGNVFPLRASIEPVGETPAEVVTLKATVAGANGGSYDFPRMTRPEGSFEIQDRQGKIIDSGKFKYG